jgi:hypothetical protein
MARYHITVHLSTDFRRTGMFIAGDSFEKAALDGCYDGFGFDLRLEANSHEAAAEVAWAICNSYPSEMHCSPKYLDDVARYRRGGNRSLSTGDLLMIENADSTNGLDGRYGVASFGFERF